MIRHELYIKNLVRKFRLKWHDGDDLAQELRVKALVAERRYHFKVEAERDFLIRASCRNRTMDFLRQLNRRAKTEASIEEAEDKFFLDSVNCWNLPASERQFLDLLLRGESVSRSAEILKISQSQAYRRKKRLGSILYGI